MTCALDPIRDDLIGWAESLWIDEPGAFRNGNGSKPHLPSSLFIGYILYSVGGLKNISCDKTRWAAWIQSQQDPDDGSYLFPPPIGSSIPRKGIALWNAKRVLGILGEDLLHYPSYQREATTIKGLHDWFRTWEALGDSHHEVLALAPTLASHPDEMWSEAFFEQLANQQHPSLGYWPKGDKPPNISRTFAYSLVHLGMDRLPPQSDRIIDTMLDLQDGTGLWHGGKGFSTMDAVFLLARLPDLVGYRQDESLESLHRTADTLVPYFQDPEKQDRSDTHKFAAPVQTLALLSQALTDRFVSSSPWRFSWEMSDYWESISIARGLR